MLISPMQFGPTSRMSCRRAEASSRDSVAAPDGPVSANPALSTTAAPTCAAPHSSMTCANARSRHGNDGQVHTFRNGADRRVTVKSVNGLGVRIDRVCPARESAGKDGAEDLVPNAALRSADTDHGQRGRCQQGAQRIVFGRAVTGAGCGKRSFVGLGWDMDANYARDLHRAGGRFQEPGLRWLEAW